jgi:hypothetical protein
VAHSWVPAIWRDPVPWVVRIISLIFRRAVTRSIDLDQGQEMI